MSVSALVGDILPNMEGDAEVGAGQHNMASGSSDGPPAPKRSCPHHPPPAQPVLPNFDSGRTFGNPGQHWKKPSLTAHLDAFLSASPQDEPRVDTMLRYLQNLPVHVNYSQLLEAEMAYLHFAGVECPILYDSASDAWYVYELHWKTSRNSSALARVYFQTSLLAAIRNLLHTAHQQNAFPGQAPGNVDNSSGTAFLHKFIGQLESREGAERIVKESCMFFDKDAQFDLKPDVFQLQNCVVDLRANGIRFGKPSDMCSRASPVMIPQNWLSDSNVVEEESKGLRQSAWEVIWSMFSRDDEFHPLDGFNDVGDQDETNFHFLLCVMARLLEGRPLCRLVVLTNPRGRNSKGVLEKIFMSVWGTYYVPTRATVFHSDRRNENEHSAAELNRRGARVAFANEVGTEPWSNAVFKGKNSSDPISARGCGAKEVIRIPRTETFVYGMNDPPTWEVQPKGSEKDRIVIIYTPNKFINRGETPTSPRTKPKDTKLEERVAQHDFALGMLLVLLQKRQSVSDANKTLDDIIGEGTPTSRMWLKRWDDEWSGHNNVLLAQHAQGDGDEDARVMVKDVHRRYNQREAPLHAWVLEKDKQIQGSRNEKWNNIRRAMDSCGRYAASLMCVVTARTRRQKETNAIWMLRLDIDTYEALFSDTLTFGSLSKYEYVLPPKMVEELESSDEKPQETDPRVPLYMLTDVFNLTKLRLRRAEGPSVTGERRPQELDMLIQRIERDGAPVDVSNGSVVSAAASDFWAVSDRYVQIGGCGRAWQSNVGTQTITREARATCYEGMTVGEIDIASAFVQLLLGEMHSLCPEEEWNIVFAHLLKYEASPDLWKAHIAQYYEIDQAQAKHIFTRFIMGGSLLPDAEWEPRMDRAQDTLPCLLQLREEVGRAQALLAEKSDRYNEIRQLPRVLASERKNASALAIFLMDAETRVMRGVLQTTVDVGLKVLSVVFDGLYVLADNPDHLSQAFDAVAARVYEDMGIKLALKDTSGTKMKTFDIRHVSS